MSDESNSSEERYQCVGVCMTDPDSGYCLGCGRPPEAPPDIVAELVRPVAAPPHANPQDPDSSA
jgi:hypothetical protein